MTLKLNSPMWAPGQYFTGNDTAADGELQHLVGLEIEIPDLDYTARGVKPPLSCKTIKVRFCRNIRGSALLPCQQVKYGGTTDSGINVTIAGAGDIACGTVDPYLPAAGVPDDGIFGVFYEGPCKVMNDATAAISVNEMLVTGATGYVLKQTAAPADTTAAMVQVNSVVGRATESAVQVAGTKFRALLKYPHL